MTERPATTGPPRPAGRGAARPQAVTVRGRERSELWTLAHRLLQPRGSAPLTADTVPLVGQVEGSTKSERRVICASCGLQTKPRTRHVVLRRAPADRLAWGHKAPDPVDFLCFRCESKELAQMAERRLSMLAPDDDADERWAVGAEAQGRRALVDGEALDDALALQRELYRVLARRAVRPAGLTRGLKVAGSEWLF
jgi:hypothetical protein